ncbi:unnamed protein product [Periconia digitata]|uniref:Uncharacterized protein n=1 Tax=Periconia digitata TaxID=1303443 RepID=A0A9W4U7V3_9PLEO|nr:unnamed protein product [Periconia digitata]
MHTTANNQSPLSGWTKQQTRACSHYGLYCLRPPVFHKQKLLFTFFYPLLRPSVFPLFTYTTTTTKRLHSLDLPHYRDSTYPLINNPHTLSFQPLLPAMAPLRTILAIGVFVLAAVSAATDDRTAECGTIKCVPGLQNCSKDPTGQDICVYAGGYGDHHSGSTSVASNPNITASPTGPFANSTSAVVTLSTTTTASQGGNSSVHVTSTVTSTSVKSSASSSSSSEGDKPEATQSESEPPKPSESGGVAAAGVSVVGALGALAVFGLF